MKTNFRKIFFTILKSINIILMAISPIALLMLIVAFIMFLDTYGEQQRRREALEEVVQTTTAIISSCNEDDRYCFADFTDSVGRVRYGKLDWRYYPQSVRSELESLSRGDTVLVRYAKQEYEDELILAEHYDAFLNDKSAYYDLGCIALVSWGILILHPEVMLYTLVDDLDSHLKAKWNRMTKSL